MRALVAAFATPLGLSPPSRQNQREEAFATADLILQAVEDNTCTWPNVNAQASAGGWVRSMAPRPRCGPAGQTPQRRISCALLLGRPCVCGAFGLSICSSSPLAPRQCRIPPPV